MAGMSPEQKKNASRNAVAMQRAQKAIRKNEDPNKGNVSYKEIQKLRKTGKFKGSYNDTGSKVNPE